MSESVIRAQAQPGSGREHHWDFIRASLMLLGIPLHAACIYVPDIQWSVRSPDTSEAVSWLWSALQTFRMPVFFVMAGYFAAMILARRESGEWLKGRIERLIYPLVFGSLLLNPFQLLAQSYSRAFESGESFTLGAALTDSMYLGPHWLKHLWFLMVLIELTVLHYLLRNHLNKDFWDRLNALVAKAPGVVIVTYMLLVIATVLGSGLMSQKLDVLVKDGVVGLFMVHNLIANFLYYMLGMSLLHCPAVRQIFIRRCPWVAVAACLGMIAYILILPYRPSNSWKIAITIVRCLTALFMAQVLISVSYSYVKSAGKITQTLIDSSLMIYLFHVPIICVLGIGFFYVQLHPVIEYVLIVVLTSVLSFGAYVVTSKLPRLFYLFNGRMPTITPAFNVYGQLRDLLGTRRPRHA